MYRLTHRNLLVRRWWLVALLMWSRWGQAVPPIPQAYYLYQWSADRLVLQTSYTISTFGSEFVAAKVATETIRGPRYKLKCCVPDWYPRFFFITCPSSRINDPRVRKKKKSNWRLSLCPWAVAMGKSFPDRNTKLNTSDILTGVLPEWRASR
jgi:hypothetical protein